jgi:redox-sensitive bicupin YhaK (pirin superfamily)
MVKSVSNVPIFLVQRARNRAYFDHGWLKTYHSFSFADYYDPANESWGALRVLNDDRVVPGDGFDTHPHRDMEIITYVLEGELEHKDSMGNSGIVGPGDVQFMSAGTGVRHSEHNHSKVNALHLLQMWVLPGKLGAPPSYGQASFKDADRLNRWLVIASGRTNVDAPVRLTQDAAFMVTRLDAGKELRHVFEPGRLGFLFVAEGNATAQAEASAGVIGAEELAAGDAVRLANVAHLTLRGTAHVVLWDLPPV